jgi:hypothetical protein
MKYFLLTFFMSVYTLGYGQNMKLGLRSGVSFSNFYDHHSPGEIPDFTLQGSSSNDPPVIPDPNSHSMPSYHYESDFIKDMQIGLFSYLTLDWTLNQRFSIELGLGYTQKGIDIEYNLHTTSINSDNNTVKLSYQFNRNLRLNYISVPLTLQYKLDRKERFYVSAGFYNSIVVDFLIKESFVVANRQTTDSFGNNISSSEGKSWTTDAYAGLFDSGLLAGMGVNLPLTKKMTIGLDVRMAVGLTNVPKRYKTYGFQSFSETTKNISFETGLKLQYILK